MVFVCIADHDKIQISTFPLSIFRIHLQLFSPWNTTELHHIYALDVSRSLCNNFFIQILERMMFKYVFDSFIRMQSLLLYHLRYADFANFETTPSITDTNKIQCYVQPHETSFISKITHFGSMYSAHVFHVVASNNKTIQSRLENCFVVRIITKLC